MHSTAAHSRTWSATVHDRPFGEYWGSTTYIVTLERSAQGIQAYIDGAPRNLLDAVLILRSATNPCVLHETLLPSAAA